MVLSLPLKVRISSNKKIMCKFFEFVDIENEWDRDFSLGNVESVAQSHRF